MCKTIAMLRKPKVKTQHIEAVFVQTEFIMPSFVYPEYTNNDIRNVIDTLEYQIRFPPSSLFLRMGSEERRRLVSMKVVVHHDLIGQLPELVSLANERWCTGRLQRLSWLRCLPLFKR